MEFTSRNRDDVLDIIRNINETISDMGGELDQQKQLADSMAVQAKVFRATFSAPGSAVWDLYKAAANFNYSAGCRTHDIELVINEARGQQLVGNTELSAFDIDLNDFKLTATPVGRPVLRWHDPRLSKADCFLFDSKWKLVGTGSSPQIVILRIELQFLTGTQQGKLKVTQTQSPRIDDDQGVDTDPLAQVPMRDGLRAQARQRLFANITQMVSNIQLDLPNNPLGAGPAQFDPHTYLVSNAHLVLVCRQLAKRRAPEPLGFSLYGRNDQAIRLKKEYIIPQISREIAAQGVALEGLEFRQGYIFLRVHQHRDDSCMWIDIHVDVWFEYRLDVLQDAPGVLFFDVNWLRWQSHYQIDNCFPVCGKVADQVKDQLNAEIPKHFHLTFALADLRTTARNAIARIAPYGLTIMMEIR